MQLLTTQQIIANGLARYQFTEQCRKVVVFSPWRRMLRLAHWAVEGTLAVVGVGGPGHRLVGGVPAAS